MKKIAALISIAAITLSGAIAKTALSQSQTVTKDAENNVFISGFAPTTFVRVSYANLPLAKTFIPNSCGIITVKSTIKEPFVFFSYPGSSMIDWNVLPTTGGKTLCKNGVPNPEIPWNSLGARSSSDPSAGITSYIKSTTPLLITSRNNFKERLVKANACGIISLKSTAAWPFEKLGNFYYQTGSSSPDEISSASLSTRPKPICYKETLYKPL